MDISPEAARELHQAALIGARRDVAINLAVTVVLFASVAGMWAVGMHRAGGTGAVFGGIPITVRTIKRWRRLREMTPLEAAAKDEL